MNKIDLKNSIKCYQIVQILLIYGNIKFNYLNEKHEFILIEFMVMV